MATKDAKGKRGKDSAKTSAKKSEGSFVDDDKKEESSVLETESIKTEEPVDVPVKEPTPEPIYDEPPFYELIIESYEGEKTKGLYEGEGVANFTGGHVYKGMFCEGFMHGRGLYKWADGVEYEGEFYQNHVTGKGVYRWPDGSYYEGDVLDGKRHGQGTFHCRKGVLSYSGDWYMGKRHGKGKMEYDSEGRSYYDGDWVNNVKHGQGKRQYPSGNVYDGMWFNNVRHGEGTMKWLDRQQMYTGNWENGVQNGVGEHIWILRRVTGSQYPLRNLYNGEFVNGLRHGNGAFHYANGARYEGGWKNNMKHGKGKFIFKNGRIYEGMFEKDHIGEFPDFSMDGTTTPDMSQIRTRTPLPCDNVSVHSNESRNTMGPSLTLEIEHLLNEFTETDREEEASQVMYVVMRHITTLRRIYNFYSNLGYEESADNTYVMNKMQFWRFLKDCKFHHMETTLMDMDRYLGVNKSKFDLHDPYEKILLRQFINNLVILSYHLYHDDHQETTPVLQFCMSRLIQEKILRHACNVQGHYYFETRRANNALVHQDQAFDVYQCMTNDRKVSPYDPSMKMREFLYMMKDLKLINNDLTPKAILDILSSDDPNVADGDGCCNMELEMTFLEFFEGLIGCAEVFATESVVKDPTTPRPSTVISEHEQSMYSMPVSRIASQEATRLSLFSSNTGNAVGLDGGESQAPGSPRQGTVSPASQSPTRAVSSAEGTNKTGENPVPKGLEVQQSVSNVTAGSINGETMATSRRESTKDVKDLAEHQKSGSFVSNHTSATEDGQVLLQSSVSIGGHTGTERDDDEETVKAGVVDITEPDEEEEELDETTRQFNFWTHQIHIFFVKKFFPAAERLQQIKYRIDARKLEEAKEKTKSAMAMSTSTANQELKLPL